MESVRSLFIPVVGENLLLPNSAVAEVVSYSAPMSQDDSDEKWFLGYVVWRDQRIPIISYEVASGKRMPPSNPKARIVVLKALGDQRRFDYFAIVSQQIPRLVTVYAESIEDLEDTDTKNPVRARYVLANGEPAVIPDVDKMEQLIVGGLTG